METLISVPFLLTRENFRQRKETEWIRAMLRVCLSTPSLTLNICWTNLPSMHYLKLKTAINSIFQSILSRKNFKFSIMRTFSRHFPVSGDHKALHSLRGWADCVRRWESQINRWQGNESDILFSVPFTAGNWMKNLLFQMALSCVLDIFESIFVA